MLYQATQAIQRNEFSLNVVRGIVPGHQAVTAIGRNPDIDTGPEDVWPGGGLYTGQPVHSAAAETVEVFSSSANDTSGGSGARTVRIFGLDANFVEQQQDITLNGVTPVPSAGTYKRVFRAHVLTAGATGSNEGILTVRHTTTIANVFTSIPIGKNQSHFGGYTVPNAKSFYVLRMKTQVARINGSAGSIEYALLFREEGAVYRQIRSDSITTESADLDQLSMGLVVPSRTDLLPRVISASDVNTSVSTVLDGVLINN